MPERTANTPSMKWLLSKPLRNCKTMHSCCLCDRDITYGDDYYDGGLDKRAHYDCVQNLLKAAKAMHADMYGGADD